jgi:hypothetical protein
MAYADAMLINAATIGMLSRKGDTVFKVKKSLSRQNLATFLRRMS